MLCFFLFFLFLARSTNLPTGLYIPLFLFLSWAKLSQDLLDQFTRIFSPNKRHLREFCWSDLFFRFLKGRCHGNRFWTEFAKWPSFNTLAFRNGFEYRNSYLLVLKGNICASLIVIGLLTPEIMQGVSVTFRTRRQKSTYLTKYLSKHWTQLCQHFSIGRHMYGNYKTDISFVVAQGTLIW